MNLPFPEPTHVRDSRAEVLLEYLDYFRHRTVAKIEQLPAAECRSSRLPSGWTPLELVKHLVFVERRRLEWRFAGREVADPFGDRQDGRWFVADHEDAAALLRELVHQGATSRGIVLAHDLQSRGHRGADWGEQEPATLERILLHLQQEYARHLGHIDIVAELAGGTLGE